MLAALPPRPPGNPPKELPPAGQRRLPDGRRPDHMWNVLQGREESPAPRRAVSREEQRRESRSLPSRPELEELPCPGGAVGACGAKVSRPAAALGVARGADERLGLEGQPPAEAAAGLGRGGRDRRLKGSLWPDAPEAKEFLERRLEGALTEQRTELARRFQSFEQGEKHFKDWVQREHDAWCGWSR